MSNIKYDKRNYCEINNAEFFRNFGMVDGYADNAIEYTNIVEQLHSKLVNANKIIKYLAAYFEGYEMGKYILEHASEIDDIDNVDFNLNPNVAINRAKLALLKYLEPLVKDESKLFGTLEQEPIKKR